MTGQPLMSRLKKAVDWTALVVALATIAVAITNYFMYKALERQYNLLEAQVQLTGSPTIIADVDEGPPKQAFQLAGVDNLGQPNEKWIFGYWMRNKSDRFAFDIRYYVESGTDATFRLPDTSRISRRPSRVIPPGFDLKVASGELFREKALELQREGKKFYRHFYIAYADERGTLHAFKATWQLDDYQVGSGITWSLLDYSKIP